MPLGLADFITDFADQAVLLPLVVLVFAAFLSVGWRRGALAWLGAIGLTFGVIAVGKAAGLCCPARLLDGQAFSPSGHTAGAAVVYGALLALVAARLLGHGRWTVPIVLACAGIIGGSRLALGVHTPAEVIVGGAVGLFGATVFAATSGAPPVALGWRWLAIAAVAVLAVAHGARLPMEALIRLHGPLLWPFSQCWTSAASAAFSAML